MITDPDMKTLALVVAIPAALGILFNAILFVSDPAGLKNDPQHCVSNPGHVYCR